MRGRITLIERRVLFLCPRNSCRSQRAEGLVDLFLGKRFQAVSAGTGAARVNPLAATARLELGIDMGFAAPSRLAGGAQAVLPAYRQVRDELRDRLIHFRAKDMP